MNPTVFVATGCDPAAFRAARECIGGTDPTVIRGASHTAQRLGVQDQLRMDWPGAQIQYIGMGESVAYGHEPVRLRHDALALLDAAIRSPQGPSRFDETVGDLEQLSLLAALVADETSMMHRAVSCAVAATPWSRAHAFVRSPGADAAGRIETAGPAEFARWLPHPSQAVLVRLASLVDGVARLVINPVHGEEEVTDLDPVALLRLHARFGGDHG